MQVLSIAGNVGKDSVLRNTSSGDPVLGFSLAVDNGKDKGGQKREATWYDCAIWGERGKALENHIKKGSRLALSGRPTVRVHEGKAYLGLTVDQLSFMGGGEQSGQSGGMTHKGGSDQSDPFGDSVPF